MAALAVLPNALVHPGKNRNVLLKKGTCCWIIYFGKIDKNNVELAKLEPLPDAQHGFRKNAPHLLQRFIKDNKAWKRNEDQNDIGWRTSKKCEPHFTTISLF